MNFEQFQASREWSDGLGEVLRDEVLTGRKGWLYCDGRLWIEDSSDWTPDTPGYGKGRWYTQIGNQEYQSDNVEECERLLYKFAESSGYFE